VYERSRFVFEQADALSHAHLLACILETCVASSSFAEEAQLTSLITWLRKLSEGHAHAYPVVCEDSLLGAIPSIGNPPRPQRGLHSASQLNLYVHIHSTISDLLTIIKGLFVLSSKQRHYQESTSYLPSWIIRFLVQMLEANFVPLPL
jgi:hypothetical protein